MVKVNISYYCCRSSRDFISSSVLPHPDEIASVISHAYIFVCCANDIAESAVVDAISSLRQAGMFREKVKYLCKRMNRIFSRYHSAMNKAMFSEQRMEIWMDLADKYCDELQPHVDKLYYQVWQSLLNEGCDTTMAQVKAEKIGADLRVFFWGGDFTSLAKIWRQVADIIFLGKSGETQLNNYAVFAVEVLKKQMVSMERFERITTQVLDEYPNLVKEIEARKEARR